MVPNPAYPTTFPHGLVRLVDFSSVTGPTSPVFVWGNMMSFPNDNQYHAFSINEKLWDGQNCATAGLHLQSSSEDHGFMNWSGNQQSHIGDLLPFESDAFSNHFNYVNLPGANKPTMYGSESIIGKTMVIYESVDDFG